MLRIRIRDPVHFDPGILPGWVKKSRSGSGMNIPDHIFEGLETIFCLNNPLILWCGSGSGIQNLFDPGSGMEKFRICLRIQIRNFFG
jgi:hypothetical protein